MSAHLTEEQITNWVIGEKTNQQHVAACERCATELDRAESAFAIFRDSATALAIATPRKVSSSPNRLGRLATAAAALTVAVVVLHQPAPMAPLNDEAPFIQIPYVAPPALYERTEIIRMDVQVAALTAAGFDVHMPDPGASVPADVLVGQDGRAHAIRFLPSSLTKND